MANDTRYRIEPLSPVTEGSPLTIKFTRVDQASINEVIDLDVKLESRYDEVENRLVQTNQRVIIPAGYFQQTLSLQTYDDQAYRTRTDFRVRARTEGKPGVLINYADGNILDNDPNPTKYYDVTFTQPEVAAYEGGTVRIGLKLNTKDHDGFRLPTLLSKNPNGSNMYDPLHPFFTVSDVKLNSNGDHPFIAKFAPGSDYTEIVFTLQDNNTVNPDKPGFLGMFEVDPNNSSYVVQSNKYHNRIDGEDNPNLFFRFNNATLVTVLDNDRPNPMPIPPSMMSPAAAPATPLVDASVKYTYIDNRTFINSFNTTTNITYNNSFNGTMSRDVLTGTDLNDEIAGYKGDDFINGGNGDDFLRGGQGNDTLIGGKGANILAGGLGDETFKVLAELDSTKYDTLRGLQGGEKIVILGGSNLTFQQMNGGVGIFNNGTMEALAMGNLSVDQIGQMTTAI